MSKEMSATAHISIRMSGKESLGAFKPKVCLFDQRHYFDADTLFFVGRFLQPYSADDIMFGNVFDRPLKLPWGFSAALKFMKYVQLLQLKQSRI